MWMQYELHSGTNLSPEWNSFWYHVNSSLLFLVFRFLNFFPWGTRSCRCRCMLHWWIFLYFWRLYLSVIFPFPPHLMWQIALPCFPRLCAKLPLVTRKLDIALRNHALRAHPTDYSLICRVRWFPELAVGSGCSHDTRMSFIPEWVSFQNEVRTAFIGQNRPAQPKAFSRALFAPDQIRMCHSPPTTRFAFSSRNGVRFQFTWYQNEMWYYNENFIRIKNRNELIPEWLVRERNFVSVSCKQTQRNIMHGSILPVTISHRATPGTSPALRAGGGELFEAVLSLG